MVALRSTRQDRALLVAVWALTLVVLAVGIAAVSPVLLLWGVVGLPGAIFLTRVHLRDTRRSADPATDDSPDPTTELAGKTELPGADDGTGVESKESPR